MIYLNQQDVISIVEHDHMMDRIEEAYRIYDEKSFSMPDRWHVDHDGLTSLYMPCFLEEVYGTKVLSIVPGNIDAGRPAIDGLMLLNDRSSGEILAILDGKILTALRTGAVGGVAVRHLSGPDASALGVVGAGVQGYYQALFASKAKNIERISLFDISKERVEGLKSRLQECLDSGVEVAVSTDARELTADSDIVITATTANAAVLPDDADLLRGKHFVGIGSYKPTMREYPDSIYGLVDTIYIDQEFAKGESGDLCVPVQQGILDENNIKYFSSYLLHEKNKERITSSTTFFKSVGMALFDVVAARYVYSEAKKRGIGIELPV